MRERIDLNDTPTIREYIQQSSISEIKICQKIMDYQRRFTGNRIPGVVQIYDIQGTTFSERINWEIIMERGKKDLMDLFTSSEEKESLQDISRRSIIAQLLIGLHSLHTIEIAHLDVNLENIVLDLKSSSDYMNTFLIDFGQSVSFNVDEMGKPIKSHLKMCNKDYTRPPELSHLYGSFTRATTLCDPTKVDIFSAGVVAFFLLFNSLPFNVATERDRFFNILQSQGVLPLINALKAKGAQVYTTGEHFISQGEDASNAFQDAVEFVSDLLQDNPDDRPTALEALRHPFLANIDIVEQYFAEMQTNVSGDNMTIE